jgi:hypothetical protein
MEPVKVIRAGAHPELGALRRGLRALEDRFLRLQQRLAREGLAEQTFLESADIILEVQRLYRVLKDERGRRNLRFGSEQQLARLDEWCRWLVRKVAEECFFRARLDLEHSLRAMLTPEAQQVYLRLVEVEEMAAEIAGLADADLADQLWQGELAPALIDKLHGLPPLETSPNAGSD